MDVHDGGSIVAQPSYHGDNVLYSTNEVDGGRLLTTGTLERTPR